MGLFHLINRLICSVLDHSFILMKEDVTGNWKHKDYECFYCEKKKYEVEKLA